MDRDAALDVLRGQGQFNAVEPEPGNYAVSKLTEPRGTQEQSLSGPVTNRTWTVLTTGALLVLGVDGLVTLLTTGGVEWAGLVALVFGVVNLVDLARRWSEI